ncbi:MAG: 16S rRNA (cytosine(967)-C(5))-methyltransferase RsmB [Terriglobales bacterium]
MAVSPARAAAIEILLKVEREQSYASELLHSARFAKLSTADHGLATELVMGVVRWRSLLDLRLAGASSQKLERLDAEVLVALRLGLYQLQFLSRIPARAAIFESVELVKAARKSSAAPFVNAVLRKFASTPSPEGVRGCNVVEDVFATIHSSADVRTLAKNAAHPEWLVARWAEIYGLEAARQICAHNQQAPRTAIHIYNGQSGFQSPVFDSIDKLAGAGIQLGPGRLLSAARTVLAGDLTGTDAYRRGRISIQDEASQLVALLVGRGEKILDCCAAPGGKTALLAQRNPRSTVVASELHPHRARLLVSLVRRPNVRVIAADARQLPFSTAFDRVLVDAPCSGTGTLARNPESKWRLTTRDLEDLQSRQIAILRSALAQLAKGGRLVYSTCSLEREENEKVVEHALSGASDLSIADCRTELEQLRKSGELCAADIDSLLAGRCLRTIPGVHPCDGFFAAIITKKK